jgi:hypothetical protein
MEKVRSVWLVFVVSERFFMKNIDEKSKIKILLQ